MNVITMTRVKHITLGVLLSLLIAGASLTATTRPALANTHTANIIDPNNISVVNADMGVYWRSDTDWSTAIQVSGQGIYTNDVVALECYEFGGTVPPYFDNSLWYWASIVSGQGEGSGWVDDHFLVTGTDEPNTPLDNVPPCDSVSANNSIGTGVFAAPTNNIQSYTTAWNGYQFTLNCWVYGDWYNGTNVWFYVPVPGDKYGGTGYVNASVISPIPVFPPPCPFTP